MLDSRTVAAGGIVAGAAAAVVEDSIHWSSIGRRSCMTNQNYHNCSEGRTAWQSSRDMECLDWVASGEGGAAGIGTEAPMSGKTWRSATFGLDRGPGQRWSWMPRRR